jgi:ABC-type branched-subunit amino acid transport system substrate-binding protein
MKRRSRALARRGAACVALASVVAGCSASGSGGSSSAVIAKGRVLTIFVSEPADLSSNPVARDVVDAERLAYDQESHQVSHYGLQLVRLGGHVLSDNARFAIQKQSAIAYLGELAPGNSEETVGITNAQQVLQVSPTDTALELGQATSAVPGSPTHFFESWGTYGRTFGRVVPTSGQEAKAIVAEMSSMGAGGVYVADDGSNYGKAIAAAVRSDAGAASIRISDSESGAAAIFYGAESPAAGARFFNSAAKSVPSALLFGSSSLDTPAFLTALTPAVKHLYITTPGIWRSDLSAAGRSFATAFARAFHHQPAGQAIFGYAAMSAVLHTLAEAGAAANNRATVTHDFLRLNLSSSVLGPFKIDSAGNTSLDAFVLNRLSAGALVPLRAASARG